MAVVISVDADIASVSRRAAQRLVTLAGAACAARGAFHLVLSGGTTPRCLYQTLAAPEFQRTIDWTRVHIYFGDERAVPPDHPDSNYGMAKAALLDHVSIPPAQIHRIDVAFASVRQDAAHYAQTLARSAPQDAQGVPQFDLILLGMGPDGHTASLFPSSCILREQHRCVAAVYVDKFQTWRVSLTYPVLNHARHLLFLVTGADKAAMVGRVLVTPSPSAAVPVQRIVAQGEVEWLLDRAAAAELPAGIGV
ncbi:MAG: 6-phosphogluconolactonase [Gammaproteobacteria bacterium]